MNNPTYESLFTILALTAGLAGGWSVGRAGRPWPWFAYGLALAAILARSIVVRVPQAAHGPWLAWADWGRGQFIVGAFLGTFLMASLAHQVPGDRLRRWLMILAALIGLYGGVLPVVSYATQAEFLGSLENRYWDNGVCRQSTDYTCGPAAAVTALRTLGLAAKEGELAQDCRTSPFGGTPGDVLSGALQSRFANVGLKTEWRRFADLNQLRDAGVTLAVVRYASMLDHWVVVSAVTDDEVHFADPLSGWGTESRADFFKRWRRLGITLHR